uniref:Uncharacterized protein n=2 Tax=Oryza sativa subsp. japonica TaxID=39947 RepID=Q7G5R5_ORYSJ|nr:hypothetical protein Os03g45010 [Oryza sativa Japonica Group]AAP68406.1 hypothetical protein [Oryza sativa Japonica Group]ABF97942.1 hypothetical protein LOC_Os03g45010 [Oryza sativa Japonica Group]
MPKVVEVRPTGARARRDGRPNHSGEADGEVRGDVRRLPGETEGWTRWRATSPCRGRGRQRRLMHGRGGRGLPEETSTRRKERPARVTAFRRNSGDAVAWPGKRTALRCRERWWRRRPAHRGRGRGGRRRNRGGNTTVAGGEALPEVSAENRG